MKLNSGVLFTFAIFLAAVCPRTAEASSVVLKVPFDPVTCGPSMPPPAPYLPVLSVTIASGPGAGTYDYLTADATIPSLDLYANCTGSTIYHLYALITVVPETPTPVYLLGTDFDLLAPISLPTYLTMALGITDTSDLLEYEMQCNDPTTGPNGSPSGDCSGMAPGDVAGVETPEPTASEM